MPSEPAVHFSSQPERLLSLRPVALAPQINEMISAWDFRQKVLTSNEEVDEAEWAQLPLSHVKRRRRARITSTFSSAASARTGAPSRVTSRPSQRHLEGRHVVERPVHWESGGGLKYQRVKITDSWRKVLSLPFWRIGIVRQHRNGGERERS